MNPWKLVYDKFDPEQENLREALCTLGNGYFGTRGAAPETFATRVHYPGTYIAGVYNMLATEMAGRKIFNDDFVNCPNWLTFNYRIDNGPWFDRHKIKILSWRRELNMRKGMLTRRMRWQDNEGRITTIHTHRIVSMANPHCGALRCAITPENYNGKITFRCGIDGQITNNGVERYRQLNNKHLEPRAHGTFGDDGIYLRVRTTQSRVRISEAHRTIIYADGRRIYPDLEVVTHGGNRIMHEFTLDVEQGKVYTIDKIISIFTSRDQGVNNDLERAKETALNVRSYDDMYKPHRAIWRSLWKRFDIEVDGDPFVQQVLRLHTFHLLQSASRYNEDIDAGIPARGLHGEAYRGHIFWDEMYIFPFYNVHAPEITRALLMYRYRRLPKAKENAKEHGFRGAMFPWQSGQTGEETSQVVHLNPLSGKWGPDHSALQRHVSIAVAYNVWNYYYTSGDRDFLDRYGAEMILEIAQFWSSIAKWSKTKKRYVIEGVMGPDEFHETYPGKKSPGLDNNAYTNVMAVWVILKALEILDTMLFPEDRTALLSRTDITDEDITRWREITERTYVPIDANGLIHQFDGYMDLKELDWDTYKTKYDNVKRVDRILKAEGLSPDEYKVAKQADVLMIFYVLNFTEVKSILERLGYSFDKRIMRKNYDYYLQRTSHGSTLSMVVHTYLAQRLGHKEKAWDFYLEALKSDIQDTQGGTTQEGIHAGVMGGTVDLFLRCFAGMAVREDRICLNPDLPETWQRIHFHVRYKNIWFEVTIKRKTITVKAELLPQMTFGAGDIPIEICKKRYILKPGEPVTMALPGKD